MRYACIILGRKVTFGVCVFDKAEFSGHRMLRLFNFSLQIHAVFTFVPRSLKKKDIDFLKL
jgi:hypothetical protein